MQLQLNYRTSYVFLQLLPTRKSTKSHSVQHLRFGQQLYMPTATSFYVYFSFEGRTEVGTTQSNEEIKKTEKCQTPYWENSTYSK